MDLRSGYKGKKVFLTGHTGFKGSWLLAWLHMLGAEIKGYALAPEKKEDLYNKINGDLLCDSVIADIKDLETLKKEILDFQPDFIFHLAAQPLVRLSYAIPLETFNVNAIGTANVLEAIRELKIPCSTVMITTDKVYHNYENGHAYSEDDKLGGYDPYSASKACAELIISSYRNSFFNPADYLAHQKSISVARAGNVIGGGDFATDRIVPDIVRALFNNQSIEVRNPNAVRPWQHVLEPLYGYLLLGLFQIKDPAKYGDAYNFGPQTADSLKVQDLVKIAIEAWGQGDFISKEAIHAVHEAHLLQLNIDKAFDNLKWKPKMNAGQAIHSTINWYKQVMKNEMNSLDLTKQEILAYMSL